MQNEGSVSCLGVKSEQLELSASNNVKVDYRLPVTCSDFNSTTVNSLGQDCIDLLPVTLSISYRCLNVVSNTDFYAICSHCYHFSNRIVTNILFCFRRVLRCVFSCDNFKIALGIWLYISAVLLTSARAHLFVNHLAESSHYANQCLSYCPCNTKRFLLKT